MRVVGGNVAGAGATAVVGAGVRAVATGLGETAGVGRGGEVAVEATGALRAAGPAATASVAVASAAEGERLLDVVRDARGAAGRVRTPSDRLQVLLPMLGELARGTAAPLPGDVRASIAAEAGAALHHLDGAWNAGLVLAEPLRQRFAGLLGSAGHAVDGDGVSLADAAGPRVAELVRPDRGAFARSVQQAREVAGLDDLELLRFSVGTELARAMPVAAGDELRSKQVRDAWRAVADSAHRLAATAGDDGAAAAGAGVAARAGAKAPLGVGWNDRAARLLGDAATRPSPRASSVALQAAFSPRARAAADRGHAVRLEAARSTVEQPAAGATLADRLRHDAAVVHAALGSGSGETWSAPDVDRYVGALAGLLEHAEAVPTEVRQAVAPRLVDDTLREIGRGLVALRERSPDGTLRAERLWPDRGRLGRVASDARVLADVHDHLSATAADVAAAAPEAI